MEQLQLDVVLSRQTSNVDSKSVNKNNSLSSDEHVNPCKKKSVGEDSAYITGPGSAASDSSTTSGDESDVITPGVAAAERKRQRQRKSWAGQTKHSQQQSSRGMDFDGQGHSEQVRHPFAVPQGLPPFGMMVSLADSSRRRLGQKRSSTETINQTAQTSTNSPSQPTARPLHRAPSSLFYLQYDDEDEEEEDDDGATKKRRLPQKGLPSSRKYSAAAYMPRVIKPPSSEEESSEDSYDEEDEKKQITSPATIKQRKSSVMKRVREALSKGQTPEEYYEDTLKQIDTITKVFRLGEDVFVNMMNVLNTEMDRGLSKSQHSSATVKMFHTFVRSLPDGTECGRYVALDLGGTNFRVLLVDLNGYKQPSVLSKVFLIPLRIMLGTGQMLFDHIVNCIAEFLDHHGLKHLHLPLGFTFSFPCTQDGLASARLVRWTKGFKCTGVENEDVVRLLHEAIARRADLHLQCVAIINDNVGVLMAGAHTNTNCRIGLILGTGTNCCYLEQLEKIELWDGDLDEPKQMIINTEWGAFGDDGVIDFIRNDYDRQLDDNSLNPGRQLFEKMISGMYMGELVRLVLCELTSRGLIFRGRASEELCEPQRFYTKYISEIESDDPAGEYSNTKLVLQELDISDVTLNDCRYVQHVCWQVSQRAAFLAGTAVAVVIKRVNEPNVTIAVDGSLYRFHPHFKDIMHKKITQLLQSTHHKFQLILANDGSGQGAALVAATASQTSTIHFN